MISNTHKLIFIHIPKTGGTSVESILWPRRRVADLSGGLLDKYHNKYSTGGLQHLAAKYVRQEIGERKFRRYLKFSIVRNPYSKAISQYSYMSVRPDLRDFIGMKASDPFERYLELIQTREHVQWNTQVSFLIDESGINLVDRILRFEDLDREMTKLLLQLNIPFDNIPKLNRNPLQTVLRENQLSSAEKGIIEDVYEKDFHYFGY